MDLRRFALLFCVLALEILAARLAFGDGSFAEIFTQYARLYRRSGAGELISNSRLVVVLLVLVAAIGGPLVDLARRRRAAAGLAMDPLLAQVPLALLAIFAVAAGASSQVLLLAGVLAGAVAGGLLLASAFTRRLVWSDVAIPVGALSAISLISILAGAAMQHIWRPVSRTTLRLAAGFLDLAGVDTTINLNNYVLATKEWAIAIEKACSGLEGMGLSVVMLSAFLLVCRRDLRFPAALALVPIGVGATYVMNAARIAALFAIGAFVSQDVATKGFHHNAGWLGFNAVVLGLMIFAQKSRIFAREALPTATRFLDLPITAYLAPLIVLLATVLTTGSLVESFDWLYGVRILTVGATLHLFRRSYGKSRWSANPSALAAGVAVAVVWILVHERDGDYAADARIAAELGAAPAAAAFGWILARVIGSVVIVPLAEELAFRGFLMRRLDSMAFEARSYAAASVAAVLFSSIVFGAVHGHWLTATAAGIVFALLAKREDGLGQAVSAHAVANLGIALYALTTGRFSLWA